MGDKNGVFVYVKDLNNLEKLRKEFSISFKENSQIKAAFDEEWNKSHNCSKSRELYCDALSKASESNNAKNNFSMNLFDTVFAYRRVSCLRIMEDFDGLVKSSDSQLCPHPINSCLVLNQVTSKSSKEALVRRTLDWLFKNHLHTFMCDYYAWKIAMWVYLWHWLAGENSATELLSMAEWCAEERVLIVGDGLGGIESSSLPGSQAQSTSLLNVPGSGPPADPVLPAQQLTIEELIFSWLDLATIYLLQFFSSKMDKLNHLGLDTRSLYKETVMALMCIDNQDDDFGVLTERFLKILSALKNVNGLDDREKGPWEMFRRATMKAFEIWDELVGTDESKDTIIQDKSDAQSNNVENLVSLSKSLQYAIHIVGMMEQY